MREKGITLVINMRVERPPRKDFHNPPMRVLWLPTFDNPIFPIPIRFLKQGVKTAQEAIESGGNVLVHCAAGVHRSVAMACCILIARGLCPEAAMELIKERRPVADPDAWYIKRRIKKFAREWG